MKNQKWHILTRSVVIITALITMSLSAFTENVNASENTAPSNYNVQSPAWVSTLPQALSANQLVVVAATEGVNATLSMHEKGQNGVWYQLLSTPALIGKNGLGKQREGDNKTPVGTFHFNAAFGILNDPGCSIPYHKLTKFDYWSGDNNRYYNQMVDIRYVPDLNTRNSEHPIDTSPYYNYCLNISYNESGTANRGSGIFLHCFGGLGYTHGCVAISEKDMKTVMTNVKPECVVVIDSSDNLLK